MKIFTLIYEAEESDGANANFRRGSVAMLTIQSHLSHR